MLCQCPQAFDEDEPIPVQYLDLSTLFTKFRNGFGVPPIRLKSSLCVNRV